jgi:hypothetical protein
MALFPSPYPNIRSTAKGSPIVSALLFLVTSILSNIALMDTPGIFPGSLAFVTMVVPYIMLLSGRLTRISVVQDSLAEVQLETLHG